MDPRAYRSGAAGLPPPLPADAVTGHPQAATDTALATVPGPYWVFMTGEEVRNLMLKGGVVPSPFDNTQMLQAVRNIAAAAHG